MAPSNSTLKEQISALRAEIKSLKAENKDKDKQIKDLEKARVTESKAKDKQITALEKAIDKAKSKKKKKDPNAPTGAKNGFMFFTEKNRVTIQDENKDAKSTEISKILGKQWNSFKIYKENGKHIEKKKDPITKDTITRKFDYSKGAKKYLNMAKKDQKRYNKEKAIYDATKSSTNSEEETKSVKTPKKSSNKKRTKKAKAEASS